MALRRRRSSSPLAKNRVQSSSRRRAMLAARQGPSMSRKASPYGPSKRPKATVIKAKPTISSKDPFGRKRKGVDKVNPAARTPRKGPTATPIPKRPTSNRPTATPIPKRPISKRTPTRRQRLLMKKSVKKSAAQRRMNDNRMTRDGISARRKSGKVSAPSQRGAVKRLTRRQRLLMKKSAAQRRMNDNRRPPSGRRKTPISKIGIPRRPSIAPPYMGPKRPNKGPIRKRPTRGPIRRRPTRGPIRKMPIGPRRRSRFGRRR
jgi:hypothetical protein